MFYSIGLVLSTVAPAVIFALPLADAYGLVKVAVALIGVFILWASCSGYGLRRSGFKGRGIDAALAAFVLAFFWAWHFSIDPMVGLLGVYGQPYHSVAGLLPAFLIFYAVHARTRSQDDDLAFKCAAAVAGIEGIVCATQLFGWTGSWEPYGLIGIRAQGTMGSPVYLAALVAPCLPPAVFMASRRRAWGLPAILGFLALTASHSRGAWIAAAGGLCAFLVASGALRLRLRLLGLAAGLLAILVAFSAGKVQSDAGRIETWIVAAQAGAERPLAGWGPDTFSLVNRQLKRASTVVEFGQGVIQPSAHNSILQAWATMGVPGALALIWLIGAGLYWKWDDARWLSGWEADDRAAAAFGSLVAVLLISMFNPVPPMAFYIVAAVCGGSVCWIRREGRTKSRIFWALGLGAIIATAIPVAVQMTAETLHSFGNMAIRNRDINLGADLLRQANELAPWDTNYAAARCDLLNKLAEIFPDNRAKYQKRALAAAAGAVKAHRQEPGAYELMATVELRGAPIFGMGLGRSALRSAKRAAELDPLVEFSAVRWGQAAILVGDEAEQRRAFARFKMVRALSR